MNSPAAALPTRSRVNAYDGAKKARHIREPRCVWNTCEPPKAPNTTYAVPAMSRRAMYKPTMFSTGSASNGFFHRADHAAVLWRFERRILPYMAKAPPGMVTPDMLTGLGLVGAV